jgi:hypothetical protein
MEGLEGLPISNTDSLVGRIRREEVGVAHVAVLRSGEEDGD